MRDSEFFLISLLLVFLWLSPWAEAEKTNGGSKVTAVRGQIAKNGLGGGQKADVGDTVESGERVVTEKDGLVELQTKNATTVRLGEKSSASFDPDQRKVKLDEGSMVVHAPPGGGPLTLEVGGVIYTLNSDESKSEISKANPKINQTNKSSKKVPDTTKK